jgi:hypothetical protein
MSNWHISISLTGVLLCSIFGCSEEAGPETAETAGVVTFNGTPVEGANVIFLPDQSSGSTIGCQAVTDAEGRFEMRSHLGQGKFKSGTQPGKYSVTVNKLDTASVASTFSPPKNLLPTKYDNPQTSGLQANVVAGQANHFEFKLEGK